MLQARVHAQTFYLIARVQIELRMLMEGALHPHGVTPMLYRLLSLINRYPQSSSADLARLLNNSPQSANELIGNLTRAGLIRKAPDASNRRILRIELNDQGKAVLRQCEAIVDNLEAEYLDMFSPDELSAFRKALTAVGKRIQQKRDGEA